MDFPIKIYYFLLHNENNVYLIYLYYFFQAKITVYFIFHNVVLYKHKKRESFLVTQHKKLRGNVT